MIADMLACGLDHGAAQSAMLKHTARSYAALSPVEQGSRSGNQRPGTPVATDWAERSSGYQFKSAWPPHTAAMAIYGFLRAPGDFWGANLMCIEIGGDTDTVAACCGAAAAGACVGLESLTAARTDSGIALELLHDASSPGSCNVAGLRALAARLHATAMATSIAKL